MSQKQTGKEQSPNLPEQEKVQEQETPIDAQEQSVLHEAKPIDISELVATIMKNMPSGNPSFTAEALADAVRKASSNSNKHQAHNMTVDEMKEYQRQQSEGNVKMIPANKNPKFLIPEREKHLMHFSTENFLTNEKGVKLSKPRFHKVSKTDFVRMSQTVKKPGQKVNPENAFEGLTLIIYHDVRDGADVQKPTIAGREASQKDIMMEMTEEGLREAYFQVFGEDPLPSDSKEVMAGLIQERIANSRTVE